MLIGAPTSAASAWHNALAWLKKFRQGPGEGDDRARGARTGNTPGRSRWPEPDKIRHLAKQESKAHAPRHNSVPAWPRAGFGLPIITRFKADGRSQGDPHGQYELVWQDAAGNTHDRLGSSLIIKPMALADGRYRPLALWLNRTAPDGDVVLRKSSRVLHGSAAPFDRLVAPGDIAAFRPLREHDALGEAFFAWVRRNHDGIEEVVL
jgi:CRISPR-associated protein Cmr1